MITKAANAEKRMYRGTDLQNAAATAHAVECPESKSRVDERSVIGVKTTGLGSNSENFSPVTKRGVSTSQTAFAAMGILESWGR
ncbi:hypothetical protein J2Y41_000965 [Arthrobacter sp. 1088]|nr:hypothetical protein [Arthrobacter sp. 1088]